VTALAVAIQDPKHYADAVRGYVFKATTPVTGVAPGTALGLTSAYALHNLAASQVDLVVLEGRMSYVSGTLGAGQLVWAYQEGDIPDGTALDIVNALTGATLSPAATYAASMVRAYSPASLVTPTLLRTFCRLGASLATTEVGPWQAVDEVGGGIIVPPGTSIVLTGVAAAGTSPLIQLSMAWTVRPCRD